jgi:hypothetical protein
VCEQIMASEPGYVADKSKFISDAIEDMAWLHFLRGVNLLMYADRREVLPHLQMVIQVAPKSEFASDAKTLLNPLERMVAEERLTTKRAQPKQEALSDAEKADHYISLLIYLWCPQMSQPGFIEPYFTLNGEQPTQDTPTTHLRDLGYAAVPALIKALHLKTDTSGQARASSPRSVSPRCSCTPVCAMTSGSRVIRVCTGGSGDAS